jgi:hypothetical protein
MIATIQRKSVFRIMMMVYTALFLVACQSPRPQSYTLIDEIKEADLIKMKEVGTSNTSDNLSGGNALTVDELTDCATKVVKFQQEIDLFKKADQTLAVKKRAVDNQAQQLETMRAKVNTKSRKQVDDFNKRLEQYKTSTAQFNSEVTQLKLKESELNAQNTAFNSACASHSYRQSDLIRLDPKLQKAVESGTSASSLNKTEDLMEKMPIDTIEIPPRNAKH